MDEKQKKIVISLIVVGSLIGLIVLAVSLRTRDEYGEEIAENYDYICPDHLVDPDTGECSSSWSITQAECDYAREHGHIQYYQEMGFCLDE